MFKKDNISDNEKEIASEKIVENKTFNPTPNLEKKDVKTIIGEHISIEGNIHGEGHLLIEGSMKGNIVMDKHDFALGSKGRFEGEIQAQNVSISGQMIGNIKTQGRVEITKEADFSGEVKAKSISIGDGAYFKGTIELDKEPHRNKILPEKSATTSLPQSASEPMGKVDKTANKVA
ncbi:MAG: polymer-forming cytoskeletal protein [Desulfobacterales bacterium]|nr:polymer-forming cytoskeletal protein [Desulfobacterales bacterium]